MDKKLIFLISPPRSGSSLLQQLLMQHPKIQSLPEPWVMLQLVSVYKELGITEGYNPTYSISNVKEYLSNKGIQLDYLKEEIKKLALNLYKLDEIDDNGYFLDKTPRYYYIIDELIRLFPHAKFIILVRNPLSVFASVMNYHFQNRIPLTIPGKSRGDLLLSYKNIISLKKFELKNILFVRYEDLVQEGENTIKEIVNFLNLKSDNLSAKYELNSFFKSTSFVDKKSLHNHNEPVSAYLEEWKRIINTKSKKKLALFYLNEMQKIGVDKLGYDINELLKSLYDHKVKYELLSVTPSYFFGIGTSTMGKIKQRLYYSLN